MASKQDVSRSASLAVIASGLLWGGLHPSPATAQAIETAVTPTTKSGDADGSEIVVQASRATTGYRPADSYVATGTSTGVLETARSINMASQQLLQDRAAVNLEEALLTLPGVNRDNSFGGTQDSFNIRGFRVYSSTASTSPGILIDGVRGAMARGFQANTDRVEVLSGPSAMLYGRTEPGGVINIVRKQPLDVPYHALEADIGSYGHYRIVADTTGPLATIGGGGLAYRLIVSDERQGYWRNVGHVGKDLLVAPSLGWKTDRARLVLAYEYNDTVAPLDRGTILANGKPVAVPRNRSFSEDFSRSETTSHFLRGSFDYDLSDAVTLRTRAAYMHYAASDMQVNSYQLSANGDLARYIMGNRGDVQKNSYVQQSAIVRLSTGKLKHEFLFGADYRYQDRNQQGQVFSGLLTGFNIYDPVYGQIQEADATPEPTVGPYFTDRNTEWGIFGQDSMTLGRLMVVAGLRWADIRSFSAAQGQVSDDSHTRVFLPSASLLYRATDAISVYGSYSTSYHPNASVPATSLSAASGPFAPEKGTGWELGGKAELLQGKLLATAALFWIDKENVLLTENLITRAAGGVRSQGLELSAAGQITPAFNLTASYTYIDATFRRDASYSGNRFVNVPKNKASVFGVYDVKSGPLAGAGFGGGLTAVSRIAVDSANSAFLDGYGTVDALIRYRARLANGMIYRIQINAKNLLDKTYYPYAAGSYRIGVGEPRSILLTAKIEI